MTANVTVCIPAYRSEPFIYNTLRSVLAQSYSDFVVEIAIEPPADGILQACADLLQDGRVTTRVNSSVLGWAGNIKQLLKRVSTPYFIILFHDDLVVNDYLEKLLASLTANARASVAYGDIHCFGDASFRLSLHLEEEPLFDRLMSFLLGGAEAVPVRGLTRTSVLGDHEFPTDQYDGFAAECEWVMHLLIRGPAIRVPHPLYIKRIFGRSETAASQKRLRGRSRAELFEGLEHHRERMLHLIHHTRLPGGARDMLELAAEAAILRRHMTFNMGAFNRLQLARSEHISATVAGSGDRYARRIQAMNLLAMSQHALIEGDRERAMNLALAAVKEDPSQPEALVHLGTLQLDDDRPVEAFDSALRAWTVAPDGNGMRQLIADCETSIESRELVKMMEEGKIEMAADRFDAAGYLLDHPDIAAAGLDPWQHYLDFGFRERRKVRALGGIRSR